MHIMAQYDAIAEAYAKVKSYNPVDTLCFYPRFYESVGDVRGKSVLDLATGSGKVGFAMSERGATGVLGVDESAAMIAIAKANQPPSSYMQFKQRSVGEMGQIGQFDVITAGWCLHYSKTEEQLDRMCKDVALNLKRDGIFVALNSNPNSPLGGSEEYGYRITAEHEPLRNGDTLTLTCFGNDAEVKFCTTHWDMETYRNAMHGAGLSLEVRIPRPTPNGYREKGVEWWGELKKHPTTAIFKCRHLAAA
jgi:SAM-dependent methyltransferase